MKHFQTILTVTILLTASWVLTNTTSAAVLYDAALSSPIGSVFPAPSDNQNWRIGFSPIIGNSATSTTNPTHTLLDTTDNAADKFGYFSQDPTQTFSTNIAPTLNASSGYTLRFQLRILAESHAPANTRAGFSVIAVSSNTTKAIELGFWTNAIFAYGSDGDDPDNQPDFLPAESVAFDTTGLAWDNDLVTYDLAVIGSTYQLFANSTALLAGDLRDYTAFAGSPNPYATPSFLFFGDNTSSAASTVQLARIEILPAAVPEPTTLVLFLLASGPLMRGRHRA